MATPLSSRGLRDQLVDRLRYEVLSGRYKEGEVIRQHEIGARFGVSRTPVREALIQLRNEGLVETDGSGGARVSSQVAESTREFLNPLRRAVEIYALRLCFDTLIDDDFDELESLVARMEKPCRERDYTSLAELDIAFHRTLIEKSQQPTLLAVWSLIVGGMRASFRESYEVFDNLMDIHREHVEILRTIRTGNRETAIEFYATKIGQPPPNHRLDLAHSLADLAPVALPPRQPVAPFRDARATLQEFLR